MGADMLKKLLATTIIALGASAPAVAGTIAEPAVEPMPVIDIVAPASDWTGFYAGVQGSVIAFPVLRGGGGVHVGYLNDMGDYVIGGELNYNFLFPLWHRVGAEAILGYDGGDVMPHVTLGAAFLVPPGIFGASAGAGLSVMASDNVMLTGRYRFTWFGGPTTHEVTAAVSYRF